VVKSVVSVPKLLGQWRVQNLKEQRNCGIVRIVCTRHINRTTSSPTARSAVLKAVLLKGGDAMSTGKYLRLFQGTYWGRLGLFDPKTILQNVDNCVRQQVETSQKT